MQKIYISFLILALAGCSGRSKQTSANPQPRKETPAGPQPNGSEGSDNKIQPEETAPGTQNGGGTNEEIVDANGNTVPGTEDSGVTPPSDSTTTPETTPTTPTTPAIPDTPTSAPTPSPTTPAATGNIRIQGSSITFQDIQFTVPSGWKLHQDTFTDGTLIISFENGTDYFRLYAKQGSAQSLQTIFVNGSNVVGAEKDQTIGGKSYKRIDTQKGQVSVSGFSLTYKNHAYYGFGRSSSTATANAVATEFLNAFK